jgi:hypothetical protein
MKRLKIPCLQEVTHANCRSIPLDLEYMACVQSLLCATKESARRKFAQNLACWHYSSYEHRDYNQRELVLALTKFDRLDLP